MTLDVTYDRTELARGATVKELSLPTGSHLVEFKDFRDKATWFRGTVLVYADFVVELEFGQHAEPRALNRAYAFTAQ